MFTLQGVPYVPEDLANQPDAAQEDGFDAVLENEDAEGEEEEERHKNAKDDNDYPQSVDIFTNGLRASLVSMSLRHDTRDGVALVFNFG